MSKRSFSWTVDRLLRYPITNICFGSLLGLDPDLSPDELEEKARLITQVLELQNTLDGNVNSDFNLTLCSTKNLV